MDLKSVRIIRMTTGVTVAVATGYGIAWPLSFISPLFVAIFLSFPVWIGWKTALQLLFRLALSLLAGLVISEFFLSFPLVCVPLYGLLFFFIYLNDTPTAPPMAAMFMTIGITIIPMMGLSGVFLSHFIALSLLFNMLIGLFTAWLFHTIIRDSLADQEPRATPPEKPIPPPLPPKEERVRLALVSTIVALTAITLFFSLNLVMYAFAMIQICFMAGAPSGNASLQVMKGNALACCIGGAAIIIAFNLLVAVPSYLFLVAVVFAIVLVFSRKIYAGGPKSKVYLSGLTTFLILLGTSTMVEKEASSKFYLRIAQIIFAGLFTVTGIVAIEHLLRPAKKHIQKFLTAGGAP